MKRYISALAVVALVLVGLSSCAKTDADQTAAPVGGGEGYVDLVSPRLFPEIVTETQDIFIGTLSHAEEIDIAEYQGAVGFVTYQFTFRVDEVLRGELSPGETVDITFIITPDIALGSPCEDGRLAHAYEGSYLVLDVPNSTYNFYRFFKIEQDGTLINFFPDYEALTREALNSEPGESSDPYEVSGYWIGQKMKDSCPKTLAEAKAIIRSLVG